MQRKSTGAGLVCLPGKGISLILGLILAAGGSGCGNGSSSISPPPERPHQGIVLQVVCPGEPTATVLTRYSRGWASRTGAEIRVKRAEMTPGMEPAAQADVWVIRSATLPFWVEAGQLQPVPNSIASMGRSPGWQDLLSIYKDRLLKWKGQMYALPLLGEAPLCFYRSDLLGEAQHRQAFRTQYHRELAPPTTWEEFADIAEYFYRHRLKGRSGPSLPPLPESVDDLDREFHTLAASVTVPRHPGTEPEQVQR